LILMRYFNTFSGDTMDDDICFDFDEIIRKDLCDRVLSEMIKDDPDEKEIYRLWSDLDDL